MKKRPTTKRKIKRVANTILMFDLETVELGAILCHLEEYDWNRTKAASSLGISLRTLRNKLYVLRSYDIDIPTSSYYQKDWSLENGPKAPVKKKIPQGDGAREENDCGVLPDATTEAET